MPAGGGFVPFALGRLGHQSAGTMTGARGARCNRGERRRETPATKGARSAKHGPGTHLGMRESQGQSRSGTPTGERALARVRASPQGEAGRPASVGVLLPFFFLFVLFRSPGERSSIQATACAASDRDASAFPRPESSDEGREGGVVLGNGVPHSSDAQKSAPRERESLTSPGGGPCLTQRRLPNG